MLYPGFGHQLNIPNSKAENAGYKTMFNASSSSVYADPYFSDACLNYDFQSLSEGLRMIPPKIIPCFLPLYTSPEEEKWKLMYV